MHGVSTNMPQGAYTILSPRVEYIEYNIITKLLPLHEHFTLVCLASYQGLYKYTGQPQNSEHSGKEPVVHLEGYALDMNSWP